MNHRLTLKRKHRVLGFNQKAWLKQYININTRLRRKPKNDFEKDFFRLMNNSVFVKTMKNVRKQGGITLVITEKKQKLFSVRTKLKHNAKSTANGNNE